MRIAPDEVSIADPAAIKTIYGVNSGFTKVRDKVTRTAPAHKRSIRPSSMTHLLLRLAHTAISSLNPMKRSIPPAGGL